jgi:hypothetical protein
MVVVGTELKPGYEIYHDQNVWFVTVIHKVKPEVEGEILGPFHNESAANDAVKEMLRGTASKAS